MNLGLVCLRHNQSSKKGFSGLKKLKGCKGDIVEKLLPATLHNLQIAYDNIKYCADNQIKSYRISSEIIPFHEFWEWEAEGILERLKMIKTQAWYYNIELITHPDQFTVINSPDPDVVANSIKILEHHYKLCQYLGIKHIILHTGGVYGDKDSAMTRFIDNYLELPEETQSLIRLENCHNYDFNDVKLVSDLCGVELCYDLHHERVINGELPSSTHMLNILRGKPRIVHISSGKKHSCDKSHADFISATDAKLYKEILHDYDGVVEVEAKAKDLAIEKFKDE